VEASVLARVRYSRGHTWSAWRFEPIDLAFRLTAAPRLRDGAPHGLDVTRQRSCALLHRGKARSSGIMKETVELAWIGSLQKTTEPHRQPPHHDEVRRGFLSMIAETGPEIFAE
jgi:hypothetical protein